MHAAALTGYLRRIEPHWIVVMWPGIAHRVQRDRSGCRMATTKSFEGYLARVRKDRTPDRFRLRRKHPLDADGAVCRERRVPVLQQYLMSSWRRKGLRPPPRRRSK